MDFTSVVQGELQKRKMSYYKLAQLAGVKTSTIGNWFSKTKCSMQLSTAIKVAKVLDIDIPINQFDFRVRRCGE